MKRVFEKVRKGIFWRLDMRLVAAVAVAASVLLIIPLLRFALYSVPWYDDYNYGGVVKTFLETKYSLGSALQGAVETVKGEWWAWQGTYSSIFFMALAPFVWNENYYFLGPIFLIIILPVSVFLLARVILKGVLKVNSSCSLIVQATVAAAAVEFIHSDRAGFYWYNSGVHYVGMHSFLILLAAGWIQLLIVKKKTSAVLLVLWSLLGGILSGGANFVTALQGLVLGISLLILGAILHRKRTLLLLPSLMVYIYGFYINVSAPGNNKRQAIFSGSDAGVMDTVSAIVNSFIEAFRYIWTFTGLRTIAAMILLAPIIWRLVKKTELRFSYPGMILLWSFCFYATGFTPSLYALGIAGLGRTLNAVKITYLLLLFANEVYWLGWLQKKTAAEGLIANMAGRFRKRWRMQEGIPLFFYLLMALVMLRIFFADTWQEGHYSTFSAYHYVHTGEANNFHNEYLARVERIVNGGNVVVVPPYQFKPAPICVDDLSEDPDNEANQSMADWYEKDAIICRNEEAE